MHSLLFRFILIILLIGFVAHRRFYTRKMLHSAKSVIVQPKTEKSTQIANLIALLALFATILYLFIPTWMSWSALPLPNWLRWLGVTVALGGFSLLQWSQKTLGENWSDQPRLIENQQLITAGPYHWIRHPIYTAFFLILGSIWLISANWFIGGLWITMTILDIFSRTRIEETLMLHQFGKQYEIYRERTGRFLPQLINRQK